MSQKRKKLLVIGACLILFGLFLRFSVNAIAEQQGNGFGKIPGCIPSALQSCYGPSSPTSQEIAAVAFASLISIGCIIGGAIVGIVGFMKKDTADSGAATARYCSNCGSPATAGTQFCSICGTAAKPDANS